MRKKYILILYFIIIILFLGVLGVLGIGIDKLNLYLKNENLLIYATGTNEKAFLNATWKMSPKEIERANKTNLSNSNIIILMGVTVPETVNERVFSAYEQKEIYLYGQDSNVDYYFFDNKLFKYVVHIASYTFNELPSEIVISLRNKFGNEKYGVMGNRNIYTYPPWASEGNNIREGVTNITNKQIFIYNYKEGLPRIIKYEWNTKTQQIILIKVKNKGYGYNITVGSTYKPMLEEIQRFVDKERESYF